MLQWSLTCLRPLGHKSRRCSNQTSGWYPTPIIFLRLDINSRFGRAAGTRYATGAIKIHFLDWGIWPYCRFPIFRKVPSKLARAVRGPLVERLRIRGCAAGERIGIPQDNGRVDERAIEVHT